ncbi:hypothetical protein Indivirus_1_65 [Indivirus ILV1]|uniref:Uncharacterized protein n=1 Tax=Indivirus ILV1 TaxID=1977633 RepID=A0A1V0SCK4_9VIRU|nr:hypothetical protein Indivirus_1_65 [Indivirus ILV1]
MNLYIFNLNEPIFHENKFVARLKDENNNDAYMRSSRLRLLGISNNIISVEFLYSSNEFYNFIKSVDDYIKNKIIENSPNWFGNHFNGDKVNNLFRSSIYLPEKLPGLPYMNFKVTDNCIVLDRDNRKCSIDELKVNMEIKLHYSIDGVEFYKNHCEVSFSVYEIDISKYLCQTLDSILCSNEEAINDTENEIIELAATKSK